MSPQAAAPSRPGMPMAPLASLCLGLGLPQGSVLGSRAECQRQIRVWGSCPGVLRGSVGEAQGGPVSLGASVGREQLLRAAD